MQRIVPGPAWPLFDTAALRRIEQHAAAALPPHTLMQRAGLAVARLALAVAPHARTVWVACGPGNNGGDGFEAAMHLKQWGKDVVVTWVGEEARAPADAKASLQRLRGAGVDIAAAAPAQWDLAIDALLGIGVSRPPDGAIRSCIDVLNASPAPVLAVDVPSGLSADTGQGDGVAADFTLSLLALKPGLFTGRGRDAAGEVWFDDLSVDAASAAPAAQLVAVRARSPRLHATHKGSYGDVAIVGGAPGMAGAALLAGTAALHAGAGRAYVALLDGDALTVDPAEPGLMLRDWATLDLRAMSVACGCGGGDAVRPVLPSVLANAKALVLDADALNGVAADTQLQSLLRARGLRGARTVLTPHPLEAARLLGTDTAAVQRDRIAAARELASRFSCVVVLKGSGSVVAGPGVVPAINATGNARLATAGTGDVLAGMIAARLAASETAFDAACGATCEHGLAADRWRGDGALTASALARAIGT